jgi:hypothetical protein
MARSDGNYFVIRGYMDGMIMGERSFDTQQEAEFYGKRMLDHMKSQYPKAKKIAVDIDSTVKHAPGPKIKTLASRPGEKAKFKVEDRFYFGKGRKERFSSIMAEISSAEDAVYDGRDVAGVKIQELLAKMRKGLMTSEEKKRFLEVVQEAKAYGMFSRPGQPERFGASDKVDGLIATAYRALRNGDKAAARRLIASAEALVQSDSSVPNYIVNELKDLKKSLSF